MACSASWLMTSVSPGSGGVSRSSSSSSAPGLRDGGDSEIAVGDRERHALGQGDLVGLDRVADLLARQVDLQRFGDGRGGRVNLDHLARDRERALGIRQTGRGLLVDEVHGHLDLHDGAGRHAQEVDVLGEVAHLVLLVGLGQHLRLGAVELDVEDAGEEAAALDGEIDLLVGDGDRLRVLLVAVDDGGDHLPAAQGPGGPLADPVAHLGGQHGVCHGVAPMGCGPPHAASRVVDCRDGPVVGTTPRHASKGVCVAGGTAHRRAMHFYQGQDAGRGCGASPPPARRRADDGDATWHGW